MPPTRRNASEDPLRFWVAAIQRLSVLRRRDSPAVFLETREPLPPRAYRGVGGDLPVLSVLFRGHQLYLGLHSSARLRAIPRDDRSGDQTSVLRQMYWNDRLDVQIEICLITQAAAIVEIELKGTLTRPRPGSASSSRGQWCRALQAASGKSQPCLHSYCHLGQCDWHLGCRSRPTHVTLQD